MFLVTDDPVKLGLVQSLNRPGGQMTGIYLFTSELEAKRLGLLRDVVPTAKTVSVLIQPSYRDADLQMERVQEAAARLRLELVVVRANSEDEFEDAFATLVQRGSSAFL